ncbi:MAG: DNA/RNA nuclease SfsA [Clostridia bacterium]|nr:DNA/RNA nuclease SfsA [Clostridia bacterium]
MRYAKTVEGVFLDRPNRFIAHVELDGATETVHVKNTGRCRELLVPGRRVILAVSDNPARRTKYDLIAVEKPGLGLVNIDSQAPNHVVREWLDRQSPDLLKPEYTFGDSRLDFYLEKDGKQILIEVKGCTLELDGIGYFPDAPTQRGTKHLAELTDAAGRGYTCFAVFVIQMPGVTEVRPNTATDPAFAAAWKAAENAGVRMVFLPCAVTEDTLIPAANAPQIL